MNREEAKKKFRQAIFKRLAEMDREMGGRVSGAELSRRIGVSPQVFSKWQAGKALPDEEHIAGVAHEIPEIYEIMGISPVPGTNGVDLPQSDPHLQRIELVWSSLKEERKIYYSDEIEKETRKASEG